MACAQMQVKFRAADLGTFQGVLADHGDLMLHVHFEILRAEDRMGFVEDLEEFARVQTVIEIVGDPGLEPAIALLALRAAAVHEVFVYAGHFRDVGMGGDDGAVGQHEPQGPFRVLREEGLELRKFHE